MIDYKKLITAQKHYTELGYKYVDLPWHCSTWVSDLTKPEDRKNIALFDVPYKCFVASAEQAFMEKIYKHELDTGYYQSITPCFRPEPVIDKLHNFYFMKLELCYVLENKTYFNKEKEIELVLIHAQELFITLGKNTTIEKINDDQYDLLHNGVELGSYGFRNFFNRPFIYGTGISLPRFDYDKI